MIVQNFIITLLKTTTQSEVDNREIYYIDLYDSTNDNIGYNISLGGGWKICC